MTSFLFEQQELIIGQTVIVKNLVSKNPNFIANQLGKSGLIRGFKITSNNSLILIIEFKDHSRVCFFEEELKILED
uniref:cytochrome b6-f complex subunit n=1 Tax=Madagascaria erythrocladioides TaxID=753684 RepID=UPI001BEF7200|nr:cytochrome b6-f complex subunit [Madagascaria erythrocladioides]QUE28995.1 Ycf86 [Madagascaria erythrocladioides]UNJ16547.1 cytochrome b6-f complex subunit [Madagascaria erythrocladioides]